MVVGQVGNDGAGSPADADNDWHVVKYDAYGVMEWEHTWAGSAGTDDEARGVTIDSNDEIIVVGYTNNGTDNDTGADFDWLVIKYDSAGAAAVGNPLWEITWESGAGASERLYDVHIDANDDAVVGGSWIEAGESAWRVAVLDGTDGIESSAWAWPSTGGPSWVSGIDVVDGRVAVTGPMHNGVGQDTHLSVLDADNDGDLVGNSVDGCPDDPDKVDPGVCGCGDADVDSDGDLVLDCDDACPDLDSKWEDEGVCGCDEDDLDPTTYAGVSVGIGGNCPNEEVRTNGCLDSDFDEIPNCEDPDDDGDGVLDVFDGCPQDENDQTGAACTTQRVCAPNEWWLACKFTGTSCFEFTLKLYELINPDPTTVTLQHFQIVNRTLYVYPNPGQSIADLANVFLGASEGLRTSGATGEWNLEIWTKDD